MSTGNNSEDTDAQFCALFTSRGWKVPEWSGVGSGWFGLLRELLDALLLAGLGPKYVEFAQVKEKFGGLRIYWTPQRRLRSRAKVDALVDLAEKEAWQTCEFCGRQPATTVNPRYWAKTLCTACAERYARKEPPRGL